VAPIIAQQDQIAGMIVVELVDLVAAVTNRHVPFQEIDEHALTRGEHQVEGRVTGSS